MSTLADLAPSAARRHGEEPFLQVWSSRAPLETLSFAAFDRLVEAAAALLQQHGAGRGVRLAVLCHACPDSLALSLAMMSMGGVVVNLNWRQPEDTQRRLLSGTRCELLLAGRGLSSVARQLVADMHGVRALLLVEGSEAELDGSAAAPEFAVSCARERSTPLRAGDGGDGRADSSSRTASRDRPSADDVALVMFTSGTSALPKAVPLTHGGLLWSCDAKARAEATLLGVPQPQPSPQPQQTQSSQQPPQPTRGTGPVPERSSDSSSSSSPHPPPPPSSSRHAGTLAFLPSFHVIGFTNNFLANLRAGVRCCLHADAPTVALSPSLLLRACAELRPTILDTVPALLEGMLPLLSSAAAASASSSSASACTSGDTSSSIPPGSNSAPASTSGHVSFSSTANLGPGSAYDAAAPLRRCAAVLYGGAPLSPAAFAAFDALGITAISQYGQTELGGMALIGSRHAPTAGAMRPVPGLTCRLRAKADATGGDGGGGMANEGELVLRGARSATRGYWSLTDDDELAAGQPSSGGSGDGADAVFDADEWATGDIFAEVGRGDGDGDGDGGGWLAHRCRCDELLLHTSGEMTNPVLIERAVLAALAARRGDGDSGGVVTACVVIGAGRPCPAAIVELSAAAPRPRTGADATAATDTAVDTAASEALMADVLAAVAEANAASPGYSHVPARLVRLLHPSQEAPLPRTAKGSIVRREVEARYGPWLEAQLAQAGANGAYGQGEEDEEEGAMATRIDEAQDSLGLAVLFGRGKGGAGRGASVTPSSAAGAPDGGRGSSGGATDADERAADVVVQHAKVFLLFAVLLRHLQRFSLKTCHAWDLIPPENTLVCVSNNMLQARATPPPPHGSAVPVSPASRPHPQRHTAHAHAHAHATRTHTRTHTHTHGPAQVGAAEGLSYLSGAAMAERRLGASDVVAPFLLLVLYRGLYHPTIEWALGGAADIGTAHLWFILMVGIGRLLCFALQRLQGMSQPNGAPRATALLRRAAAAAGCADGWRRWCVPSSSHKDDRRNDDSGASAGGGGDAAGGEGHNERRHLADACSACARAPRLRLVAALLLLAWRLWLAPTHIGLQSLPSVRARRNVEKSVASKAQEPPPRRLTRPPSSFSPFALSLPCCPRPFAAPRRHAALSSLLRRPQLPPAAAQPAAAAAGVRHAAPRRRRRAGHPARQARPRRRPRRRHPRRRPRPLWRLRALGADAREAPATHLRPCCAATGDAGGDAAAAHDPPHHRREIAAHRVPLPRQASTWELPSPAPLTLPLPSPHPLCLAIASQRLLNCVGRSCPHRPR